MRPGGVPDDEFATGGDAPEEDYLPSYGYFMRKAKPKLSANAVAKKRTFPVEGEQ